MGQDIYKDRQAITDLAIHNAKEHGCNYNVILFNPIDGEFGDGSTYEFVADSYFKKERPNVILLDKTDDLIPKEANEGKDVLVDSDFRKFDRFDDALKELVEVGESGIGRTHSVRPDSGNYMVFDDLNEIHSEASRYTRNWTQPYVRTGSKPSHNRNKPCPCESGKKFKKCCGKIGNNE